MDLLLLGALVVEALRELLDRRLQLPLLLPHVHVVPLQILVLLLGKHAVKLNVQVPDHVVQLPLRLQVVRVALTGDAAVFVGFAEGAVQEIRLLQSEGAARVEPGHCPIFRGRAQRLSCLLFHRLLPVHHSCAIFALNIIYFNL